MDAASGWNCAAHPHRAAMDKCVMGHTDWGCVIDLGDRCSTGIAYFSRGAGIYPPLPGRHILISGHHGVSFLAAGTALFELVLYAVYHPRRYSDPGGSPAPL